MPKSKKKSLDQQVQHLTQMINGMMNTVKQKPNGKKRRNRNRRKAMTSAGAGEMILERTELLKNITVPANQTNHAEHVDLIPDSFPFLKNLAKSFDRIQWQQLQFFYKPAVGTTVGGLISMGMDWDWAGTDLGRDKITAYTPSATNPIWQDTEKTPMILPSTRLQLVKFYEPKASNVNYPLQGPGKVHIAVDTTTSSSARTVGEIWARYRVLLAGTSPA